MGLNIFKQLCIYINIYKLMEISKDNYNKIQNMIQTLNKSPGYEFEARICSKNFSENIKIDFYKFENILNHLIFAKDLGGYQYKYTIETTLDVKINDYRLTIDGKDSVKMYWLMEDLDDKVKYRWIKKKNIERVDINDYNIRINLASEDKIDDKTKSGLLKDLKDTKKMKTYRLKNRYYIETEDKMFRFDLTSVKMSDGISFRKSGVFKQDIQYELELEYIGDTKSDVKSIFENLFKNLNIMMMLYQDSDIIIKNSEQNDVIESYKNLITYTNKYNNNSNTNPLFIVANPVTLHKINLVGSHIPNIINDYAVALKADGIRNLLYILNSNNKSLNGNIYLIDGNLNIKSLGIKNENWAGSIIEGEYIRTDNLFLGYDMLYERGNDIRKLPLIDVKNSRLGYMELCLKSLDTSGGNDSDKTNDNIIIQSKTYKYGDNIFEKLTELWENRNNYDFNVDGLIFTPIKEPYPNKVGTWDKLFKWKPAIYNSFDFLVKIEKNEKGQDIKSPYIIYKDNGEPEIYQYKTLKLYVGRLEYDEKEKKKIYKPIEFNPLGKEDESEINRAKIVLDVNEKMMAKDPDPTVNKYEEILDDTIVEFVYNKTRKEFNWIPIRIRHDKTQKYKAGESIFGNNEKTANDIWKSVINPLTFDELSLGQITGTADIQEVKKEDETSYYACQNYEPNKRLPFQNFHNLIVKMNLIKEVAPEADGKLLDLACGKAGDLSKWTNAGYVEVISIDIDRKCLEYALQYYDSYNNKEKPEVEFIWGDTSKLIFPNYAAAMNEEAKKKLKDSIPSKYKFDVVSCQFCLHYYFESELKLRSLLQNINDNLAIGGYFIGTCFDGERIMEILKGKNNIEGKLNDKTIWKIEKLYKGSIFNSNKSQYGKNINVFVSSIGGEHIESLVNFNFFNKMLEDYGFEKVKVVEFAELYNKMDQSTNHGKASRMSEVEKDFSFLNNMFIYKKVDNTSDSLYKKLKTLIDKSKKETTSGTKKLKIKTL